jgi:hypothetical protein
MAGVAKNETLGNKKIRKYLKIVALDGAIEIEHSDTMTVDDLLKIIERLAVLVHDRIQEGSLKKRIATFIGSK